MDAFTTQGPSTMRGISLKRWLRKSSGGNVPTLGGGWVVGRGRRGKGAKK